MIPAFSTAAAATRTRLQPGGLTGSSGTGIRFGAKKTPTEEPISSKSVSAPRKSWLARLGQGILMLALNGIAVGGVLTAYVPLAENGREIQRNRSRHELAEANSQKFSKVLDRHLQSKTNISDMLLQRTLVDNPDAALKNYLSEVLPPEGYERSTQILKRVQDTYSPTAADYQEAFNAFVRDVALKYVDEPNRQRVLQEVYAAKDFTLDSPVRFPAYEVSQDNLDKQTFYRMMMGLSLLFFGGVAVTDLVRYPMMRKPFTRLRQFFLP